MCEFDFAREPLGFGHRDDEGQEPVVCDPWQGVNLPGLRIQHGRLCTPLGLVLLLTKTVVTVFSGLTFLLRSTALVERPPLALFSVFESSDTRPMRDWLPRVL